MTVYVPGARSVRLTARPTPARLPFTLTTASSRFVTITTDPVGAEAAGPASIAVAVAGAASGVAAGRWAVASGSGALAGCAAGSVCAAVAGCTGAGASGVLLRVNVTATTAAAPATATTATAIGHALRDADGAAGRDAICGSGVGAPAT